MERLQAEEPWKGSDRKLDINRLEMLVNHGEAPLDQRLKDTLVEHGSMHRWSVKGVR